MYHFTSHTVHVREVVSKRENYTFRLTNRRLR